MLDFREALVRFQRIVDGDRENLEVRRDLSNTYQSIGMALAGNGRRTAALEAYRKALLLLEELGRVDPTNRENAALIDSTRAHIAALERGDSVDASQ